MTQEMPGAWREALALSQRRAPELYQPGDNIDAGPHADAIRFALDELGLSAVFCIEQVPTIALLADANVTADAIDAAHRALWNQGIMSLLLVISDDELRAYSLVRRPFQREGGGGGQDPRLIETLSLVRDALVVRELVRSAESGRYWIEYDQFFDPSDRVDSVLLDNLLAAYRELHPSLGMDAAQALLMQSMFIAYLEDRSIIGPEVFKDVSDKKCTSFADILAASTTTHFEDLFIWLRGAFNGDIFNAPCAFDLDGPKPSQVKTSHLGVLGRFRHGREEMMNGQLRFFGYDFKYIPVALISAVYDRFLKEEAIKKNSDGAFYTPMFLADVVVNQLWEALSTEQKQSGVFADPACGSGVFLVRIFQRLVADRRRAERRKFVAWDDLTSIAKRLRGGDINATAVRVAAFSLYIALLEHSNPRDLPKLIAKGKLLPSLYRVTLLPGQDFFAVDDQPAIDIIVGNPPWKGRSGEATSAQRWCKTHDRPDPANDIAWGFIWKALKVVKPDGLIAFLLPAMGVFHNTSAQTARRLFLKLARVERLINFSDLCFQLFDGAERPTGLALFRPVPEDAERLPYRFDYWVPKADLTLRLKRILMLRSSDRLRLRSDEVDADPALFKRRLWTRSPEERLLQFLKSLPRLGEYVVESKRARGAAATRSSHWIIGQGFQPALRDRVEAGKYEPKPLPELEKFPYLDADDLTGLVVPPQQHVAQHPNWLPGQARRRGFVDGFYAPHILIPQGIERAVGRLRAAYSDQDFIFQHSLQSLAVPTTDKRDAKLLTGILNSRLAGWFYFHETANLGTDRAKILQTELLKLPFAKPHAMPDPAVADEAAEQIVQLIDKLFSDAAPVASDHPAYDELDELVYRYYGLDERDSAIIDETFEYIIPAMQPRRSAGIQKIWMRSSDVARAIYAKTISDSLGEWFDRPVKAQMIATSTDLGILRLSLLQTDVDAHPTPAGDVEAILNDIAQRLPHVIAGNVQTVPDLRVMVGNDLFLVKPLELRHWLVSTALADAEDVAAELQRAQHRASEVGLVSAGR
jgi:hypothetical protein